MTPPVARILVRSGGPAHGLSPRPRLGWLWSDACDRLRYEAIAKPELKADGATLAIRIKPDETAGALTMADTGIGMDRQELIDNLGIIARSGTRDARSRLCKTSRLEADGTRKRVVMPQSEVRH